MLCYVVNHWLCQWLWMDLWRLAIVRLNHSWCWCSTISPKNTCLLTSTCLSLLLTVWQYELMTLMLVGCKIDYSFNFICHKDCCNFSEIWFARIIEQSTEKAENSHNWSQSSCIGMFKVFFLSILNVSNMFKYISRQRMLRPSLAFMRYYEREYLSRIASLRQAFWEYWVFKPEVLNE